MARKPITDMSAWPSLTLEGNLIAPAMVASIDRRQAPEQTEEHYRIRKGLSIREEISTAFRVGQSHFDVFAKLQNPSAEATRRFVRGFLAETFGFDDLVSAEGIIAFLAGGRAPIVVVPPSDEKLDRRSATLSVDRPRSPALALQDYLNDSEQALWGLVTNGSIIRLMRDNASLTRPAYVEADLTQIFANDDAASFAVLWSLIHRTRFGVAGAPVTDCALERWREAGAREGEAARDRLAAQVKIALKALGSGFLEANPDLAARLKSGEVNLTEWFNELLRLVYRLIFLMVAEDRNLLHPETAKSAARKLYVEGYSLAALRAQCVRAASWDKHHDRYEGIRIVFRALAHGQTTLGLPALGGLFGDGMLPHLETARLRNRAFMEALYRLAWLKEKTGMVPVNWRAMETEELGSVYESLLELQPQLGDDGKTLVFALEAAEKKGNQRKTTGSYYTPDSLVQALLDSALDPVLDKTEAEADPAAALLKLSIIDPACGSGHFLLAAARRIATRVARIRAGGTPALTDFRHALRDVARSCLHGVDRNPMAVELTKVALWIETVDPGLPLGFFDAQIRCGDALLGVFDLKALEQGIPDAAMKPLTGDDKEVAKYYAAKNKREKAERDRVTTGFGFNRARDLMRDFTALRAMPEDTVDAIDAKAARLRSLTGKGAAAWQLEAACDLYVAAFLLPKVKGGQHSGPDGMPRRGAETVPTSGALWEWLRGISPFGPMFGVAIDSSRSARAFHWPLEFPNVMQRGGFDVVLGNPPFGNNVGSFGSSTAVADERQFEFIKTQMETARGAFDISTTFFELAIKLLRISGSYALFCSLGPWASSGGAAWRDFLIRNAYPRFFLNASKGNWFPEASVQVGAISGLVGQAKPEYVRVVTSDKDQSLSSGNFDTPLNPRTFFEFVSKATVRDIRLLEKSCHLSERFDVFAGCTTGTAYELIDSIVENALATELRLINTKLIDRYRNRWGKTEIIYLKNKYYFPQWSIETNATTKSVRAAAIRQKRPKLLVAGLTKVIEAAPDYEGQLAGVVQTWIICEPSDNIVKLRRINAILNSWIATYLYWLEEGAQGIVGGGMTIKKAALASLRVPLSLFDVQIEAIVPDFQELNLWSIPVGSDATSSVWRLVESFTEKIELKSANGETFLDFDERLNALICWIYGLDQKDWEWLRDWHRARDLLDPER